LECQRTIRAAGRPVFAAMPSSREPGSLFVWDFGVSGVLTHAWKDLRWNVSELFGLPEGHGVLSVPAMRLFTQEGSSREITEAKLYASSTRNQAYGGGQLFATSNRGQFGQELAMLQVYRAEDLMSQTAAPVASLSGFESEITAMTFANTHRAIAFSVRERNGYRLMVADPVTLDVRSLVVIEDDSLSKPWLFPPADESGRSYRGNRDRGVPGPTTVRFSPDDRSLVVHSRMEDDGRTPQYTYTVYQINWPDEGLPSPAAIQATVGPVDRESPFFAESGIRPLFFVTSTNPPAVQAATGQQLKSSDTIAFRNGNELQVVHATEGKLVRKMPLMTSGGQPRYDVTADGQWYVTGNDRGAVKIGNLLTGREVSLTADERPAHSGPIVGAAIADTNPKLGLPEYVVTVGEENRLKVWDILSRIRQ